MPNPCISMLPHTFSLSLSSFLFSFHFPHHIPAPLKMHVRVLRRRISLSLSLSHTNTHTHTHTLCVCFQFLARECKCKPADLPQSVSWCLCDTYKNFLEKKIKLFYLVISISSYTIFSYITKSANKWNACYIRLKNWISDIIFWKFVKAFKRLPKRKVCLC